MDNIAIIIPTYKQYSDLKSSEKKSFFRTCDILHKYDIILATHAGINTTQYVQAQNRVKITSQIFDHYYFTGLESYNKLLLGLNFYERFANYKYILICQLDVFVFADHLNYFVSKDYDYAGAPWFEGLNVAKSDSPIIGVGNGGFSLRKTQSFISILCALEVFADRKITLKTLQAVFRQRLGMLRVAKHEYDRRSHNYNAVLPWETTLYEDVYWGTVINSFFTWFKVASVKDATSFAFEVNPEVLYRLNNFTLPMATHAWEKHNPRFWSQFIK